MSSLKPHWAMPECPDGYTQPVVHLGMSGAVRLDFIAVPKQGSGERIRAFRLESRARVPQCEWPWLDGYKPSRDDWESLGFRVEKLFDCCFGSPKEDTLFEDWIF